MSIYTDGEYLVSDESEIELHAFAKSIRLKRQYYDVDMDGTMAYALFY